jgi:xanthine/CO dehydrogenase XdhC/CoxF family maturation factor
MELDIFDEIQRLRQLGQKAALATVVKVRGSSYRSPGARMLITDDGKWVGSISGGCLEGDALRKARQVMTDKLPFTVTYDTREESNQNLGIGLGCNGVIDVLIEPLDAHDENNAAAFFERIISTNSPLALATVFAGHNGLTGKKILLSQQEVKWNELPDSELKDQIINDLQQLFESKQSVAKKYTAEGNETEVFIELLQPSISVIIFGGGFDARPVPAARIRGNDLSALYAVLGSQALALDTIFAELVKKAVADDIVLYDALSLALKAQSQSRAALDSLVAVSRPRALATRPNGNFDEQTAANGNSSSR